MNANAQAEIYAIRQELKNIINELNSVADIVTRNSQGLGAEQCAQSIRNVADKYELVRKKLNNIDTNKVASWYSNSLG